MNQKSVLQRVRLGLFSVLIAAAMSGAAFAAEADVPPAQPAAKKKKADKPKSARVKFMPGSEETRAERRARLKIECKGAVNAGVCTGYTR
ncbi:MAG: hypothetical protein HYX42_13775 [Polaromonas sp.]|uniref:hypothetical protein n=1 Tax=Polaromonas sp. TaxID=1869339 RepID=UPI0025D5F695|nr:hypothetical protein [Polaromonas sp.]MBI2727308.1 hypothetical protein [Polaromonas sp.]